MTLLRDLLSGCARSFPEKTAFVDQDRRVTWSEVEQRARKLLSALREFGLGPGDAVAILATDRLELIEHALACFTGGFARVGINWRFAAREMTHIVRDARVRVLLVDTACRESLEEMRSDLAADGVVVIGFGEGHGLDLDYETLMARAAPVPAGRLPDLAPETVAALTYTTGTTGLPKAAIWTHAAMAMGLRHLVLGKGLRHEDVWLAAPPGAGAPLMFMLYGLMTGLTTVLPGRFDSRQFLELVERHRVTSTILIPTMIRRVVAERAEWHGDATSLRLMSYGSMPAPPVLIREAMEAFPGCEFMQLYGGTETCGGPVSLLRHRDHLTGLSGDPRILASCGRPFIAFEVVVRDERGRDVKVGEIGEVWMRSDSLMSGYLNLADETAGCLRDGWLTMGDLGYFDERGYLFLVDRKKFMIISGGYNVYPAVVEAILAEHPAVREVSVVGLPDPDWGEIVAAAVSLRPSQTVTSEELIRFCRGKVGLWEVPKRVAVLDELPKGSTGKIQKRAVRAWFEQMAARPATE